MNASHSKLTPLQRAKWNLAVLAELTAPGHMELAPVWDAKGGLRDFAWRAADGTATLSLGCAGQDMSGRRLRDALADRHLAATLHEAFELAFRTERAQSVTVKVGDWAGLYRVSPSGSGVSVVVTSTSAVLRVITAQRIVRALEASSMQKSHGGSHGGECSHDAGRKDHV